MHSDSWDDDSWDLFQSQFQFSSAGKTVDISWFVEYLRDSTATEVDLDELVRENQKALISRKHSSPSIPPNKIRKAKFRRRLQRASHSSRIRKKSSSSSHSEKRPLETQTSVSRTRLLLSSGTRTPPVKVSQTVSSSNGSPSKQQSSEENTSYYQIKSALRPVSLRTLGHVTERDEVDNPLWGHPLFTQNQVSPVNLSRINSRENDDWRSLHRKTADDDGDKADDKADDSERLNPLAVSELVSRFENVRRQVNSSHSRNRLAVNSATIDPIIRQGAYRHSYHGDITSDSRSLGLNGNQWNGRPARDQVDVDHDHLPALTPSSTTNRQSLTRMESEGTVLMRSNQHRLPPDQYSRLLMSEPRRVTKGLSLDSVGRDHYHLSRGQSPHVSPRGSQRNSIFVHLAAGGSTDLRRDNIPSRNQSLSSGAITYVRPEIVVEAPRWESDVEIRKKTNHSFAHSHRPPEQPIIIGTIPEWKKQLMQKNREKHGSNDQNINQFNNRKTVTTVNHTDPPWKTEFEMIRRRQATQHGHQLHYQPLDHEWLKESHA